MRRERRRFSHRFPEIPAATEATETNNKCQRAHVHVTFTGDLCTHPSSKGETRQFPFMFPQ